MLYAKNRSTLTFLVFFFLALGMPFLRPGRCKNKPFLKSQKQRTAIQLAWNFPANHGAPRARFESRGGRSIKTRAKVTFIFWFAPDTTLPSWLYVTQFFTCLCFSFFFLLAQLLPAGQCQAAWICRRAGLESQDSASVFYRVGFSFPSASSISIEVVANSR